MDHVRVYANVAGVARAVADEIVALAETAIDRQDRFGLGLSGGSTAGPLFELLARDEYSARIDWLKVHVFWADERCVPPDHPDSNFRLASEKLLERVPVPRAQIYRMPGEKESEVGAADYEHVLRGFFPESALPRFDLLLQGMGEDGHTASLFPGTPALHEQHRWVITNQSEQHPWPRITLTVPAINAAANIVFMVTGEKKAPTLRAVLRGPYQPERLPAQLIRPDNGNLVWIVDQAAASQLE
jgi:6-phosphogluconolactonase